MTQLQSLATVLIRLWATTTFVMMLTFSLPSWINFIGNLLNNNVATSQMGVSVMLVHYAAPLVIAALLFVLSRPLAGFICRGLTSDPILSRISSRGLATIGTGLIGIYLLANSLPRALEALLYSLQSSPGEVQEILMLSEGFWGVMLPPLVGFLLILSSVPIGHLLSDYRKLGLVEGEETDSAPNPPRQNSEQS